jgi:hypothetical protein
LLLSSNAAPLFGALNIFGVIAGVWLAGRWAKKRQMKLPSTRTRRQARPADEEATEADTGVSTLGPQTVAPPVAH